MKYEWDYEDQPSKDQSAEMKRQKGFKQAKSIDEVIKPYLSKKAPKSEIDPFMQWDKPREER